MKRCSEREFGRYDLKVSLKFPPHMLAINGGYYTQKDSCSVDPCLVDEIKALWSRGIVTVGCCCGHGIDDGMINVYSFSDELKMLRLGYRYKLEKDRAFRTFYPKSKHVKQPSANPPYQMTAPYIAKEVT